MRPMWTACARSFLGTVLVSTFCALALRAAYHYGAASQPMDMPADPQGDMPGKPQETDAASLARSLAIHNRSAAQHEALLDAYNMTGDSLTDQLNMWDMFGPTFPCIERERYGEVYDGGKWVCSGHDVLSREPCYVFSLGSNGQCGFERDIRARYPHCQIEVYDPTIKLGTARKVERLTEATVHREWIVDEATVQARRAESEAPQDPDPDAPPRVYTTVAREMAKLGAPSLNVLKVDIEGAEWAVLDDYFVNGTAMPFAEILIELHVLDIPQRWGYDDLQRLRHFFRGLAAQGFRIANSELNMRCKRKLSRNCMHFIEYTLVKMDDSGNVLVS